MIIPRSVAMSLPLNEMTANEVLQDRHNNGLKAMLESLCIMCKMYEHNVYYPSHLIVSKIQASLSLINQYVEESEWAHCYWSWTCAYCRLSHIWDIITCRVETLHLCLTAEALGSSLTSCIYIQHLVLTDLSCLRYLVTPEISISTCCAVLFAL